MIQKVLHRIALSTHDFTKDLGQSRDGSRVVVSKGRQFPQRRFGSMRMQWVRLEGVEWICDSRVITLSTNFERYWGRAGARLTCRNIEEDIVVLVGSGPRSMDEHHAAWMQLEQIVDERDDHDDRSWRSRERESSQSFDKRSDEG